MKTLIDLYFFLFGLGMFGGFLNTSKRSSLIVSSKVISPTVYTGAERMDQYLPFLKGKRVGIFANQTSRVERTQLVDSLRHLGITISVIFGPEHGFRGVADAGANVATYIDKKTGIKVISLYGSKRRPSKEDLAGTDVMIFDIQDVGTRFYTYISSLQEFMEAAFEYGKPLLLLDRPNPNGYFVDGPVLDTAFRSFVGMQPVPVAYGMTLGEYASMLIGMHWLKPPADEAYSAFHATKSNPFLFRVIPCRGYTHKTYYELPVPPSPNLKDMQAVYWYPTTCFFEGTVLSEGRGTRHPFEIVGHPLLPPTLFSFVPTARSGATEPKLKDQTCYGWNLYGSVAEVRKKINGKIRLGLIMEAYGLFPKKDEFFIHAKKENLTPQDYYFNKLAGTDQLMTQIRNNESEAEIRKSWEPGLEAFKKIRKKFLLYPDFE